MRTMKEKPLNVGLVQTRGLLRAPAHSTLPRWRGGRAAEGSRRKAQTATRGALSAHRGAGPVRPGGSTRSALCCRATWTPSPHSNA